MQLARAIPMKAAPIASTGRPLSMIVRIVLGLAFLALAAWMAYQQNQGSTVSRQEKSPTQDTGAKTIQKAPQKIEKKETPATPQKSPAPKHKTQSNPLIMKGLTLKDQDGAVVFKGEIDLTPTLKRIQKGESFPHRNDGAAFGNRERRLPQKPPGYYTEYVVPTPDVRGPGPQRLVIGESGEVYYTSDHYRTFKRIPVPKEFLPDGDSSKDSSAKSSGKTSEKDE